MGQTPSQDLLYRGLINHYPITSISFIIVIIIVVGGYIMRVFEYDNKEMNFKSYFNSCWFSTITMFTVGYGDYYPFSLFGWFFALIIALTGIMATNLATANLQKQLQFT